MSTWEHERGVGRCKGAGDWCRPACRGEGRALEGFRFAEGGWGLVSLCVWRAGTRGVSAGHASKERGAEMSGARAGGRDTAPTTVVCCLSTYYMKRPGSIHIWNMPLEMIIYFHHLKGVR